MNVAGVRDHKWSNSEKKIARQAFERAYQRECEAIQKHVRAMLAKLTNADDIWRVHDFLSKKRCEVDDKYDYRYSVLIFVFAKLLSGGKRAFNQNCIPPQIGKAKRPSGFGITAN